MPFLEMILLGKSFHLVFCRVSQCDYIYNDVFSNISITAPNILQFYIWIWHSTISCKAIDQYMIDILLFNEYYNVINLICNNPYFPLLDSTTDCTKAIDLQLNLTCSITMNLKSNRLCGNVIIYEWKATSMIQYLWR